MIRKLVRRPSPATAIASLALFVSLSGVSYGVATGFIDSREIRNDTILSRDVKNSTVRTQDLRNNEIRGADIRNSTITGRDVALNTLGGQDIDESKLGKVGDADTLDGVDSGGFLRPDGTGFAAIPGATGTRARVQRGPAGLRAPAGRRGRRAAACCPRARGPPDFERLTRASRVLHRSRDGTIDLARSRRSTGRLHLTTARRAHRRASCHRSTAVHLRSAGG